jgi:hypothetical protein
MLTLSLLNWWQEIEAVKISPSNRLKLFPTVSAYIDLTFPPTVTDKMYESILEEVEFIDLDGRKLMFSKDTQNLLRLYSEDAFRLVIKMQTSGMTGVEIVQASKAENFQLYEILQALRQTGYRAGKFNHSDRFEVYVSNTPLLAENRYREDLGSLPSIYWDK